MEAPPGIEPGMEVLQTSALPLGDGALENKLEVRSWKSEVRSLLTPACFFQFVLEQQHSTSRSRLVIGVCRITRPLLPADSLPNVGRESRETERHSECRERTR